MLGTIIEQNGDGLLEDSHMPVGWPLHIDGAVRQCCIHRSATLQELDDMLGAHLVKTRQLRSLSRCKPADRPSSKKMAAKCLLPLSLTGHSRTRRCASAASNRKRSTWGTHGCHLLRRDHCAIQVLSPWGSHGWLVLLWPRTPPIPYGHWPRSL